MSNEQLYYEWLWIDNYQTEEKQHEMMFRLYYLKYYERVVNNIEWNIIY